MKKLLFILFISLMTISVNAQGTKHQASKPARTTKVTKGGKGSVFVKSGTFTFYSDALKIEVVVNAYGRYSSVVVDGTEFLGTVKKGHIVAKEDDTVVFDGYMYNGGKVLRGLFYGKQASFTRK